MQAGPPHHLKRLRGDRGGDVGVAVAVPAHPRPEREQRRHRDLLAREGRLDRRLELAVELRHDAVQRRGEVDEPGVDLVARGGGGRAHLVGPPELLDRSRERAVGGRLVPGHGRALVEVAQAGEDAGELLDRRAPPRLGGVCGHDQPELGAGEHVAQLIGGRAALGEVLDRGAQGAGTRRAGVRALAAAQAADALVVLGQIDELEPARERAHEHLRVVERERGDELLELACGAVVARPRALAERGGALVQRDGRLSLAGGEYRGEELEQELPVVDEGAPAEVAERCGGGGFGGHGRLTVGGGGGSGDGRVENICRRGLDSRP